jgi:hypothetical protein
MILNNRQQRLAFMQRQYEVEITRNLEMLEKQIERELARAYKNNLDVVKKKIADLYEKYAKDGVLTRGELTKYKRFEAIERELADEIRKLTRQTVNTTSRGIKDAGVDAYLRGRYGMEGGLGVKTGLYNVNERLIESILTNPFDRIGWESRQRLGLQETFRRLTDTINEGAIQGYSYDRTAALITERHDKDFQRTMRIVRTEEHRATNVASNMAHQEAADAAERLGIEVKKVWRHYAVGDYRDNHADILDGQVADKDGLFHLNGLSAEYPGGFGVPGEDINCRCTVTTEIIDDEEGRLEKKAEVPKYSDWLEEHKKKILEGE